METAHTVVILELLCRMVSFTWFAQLATEWLIASIPDYMYLNKVSVKIYIVEEDGLCLAKNQLTCI